MYKDKVVSILTTVYNRQDYLAQCIESVINQNYQNWELIITDDHSNDNSYQIAADFAAKDNRIKVFRNKKNLGQFANRNYAASLAKGQYIKYLDSDDILYPYALDAMVNYIEQFPQAGAAISHTMKNETIPYPIYLTPHAAYKAFFFNTGFPNCGPSAAIIRRNIFEKVKGFPYPFYVGTDTNLWLEIAAISGIVKMPPSLIWYRQHDEQAIKIGIKSNEYLKQDYLHHISYLQSASCPLTDKEKEAAIILLKKRQLRKIFRLLQKHPLEAIVTFKHNKFSISDLKNML